MTRKCVCLVPVEIYDDEIRGTYQAGQVIEGRDAELLVKRYAGMFSEDLAAYVPPAEPTQEEGI